MKKDFIPKTSSGLNVFEKNFLKKITKYASLLEIKPADEASFKKAVAKNGDTYIQMTSKRAESKAATEDYIASRKESISEIRRASKMIKSSKKYSSSIGLDLGINAPMAERINTSGIKPELKVKVDGRVAVITFRKNGTKGIVLYSRRAEEKDFKVLEYILASPYKDERKKIINSRPEQREYYAFYFHKNKIAGEQSDIAKAIIP